MTMATSAAAMHATGKTKSTCPVAIAAWGMPAARQVSGSCTSHTQLFMTQVAQSTACNRIHTTEQRLARWLLVVADRVGQESYPLTQEVMAQMLGVRRATVTEAAGALQAETSFPTAVGS
jgi:hypothetical protein